MQFFPFILCLFTGCSLLVILTCSLLLKGIVFLTQKKKTRMALIYCHHIIKLSKSIFFFFPTKPFAYLCTHNWFSVISPAKCHQDNWALQQGWYKALTEVLIDCHILSQLWNTEEERERGWVCTQLLNLKKCFCAKHFQRTVSWKYHFVFFQVSENAKD